MDNTYHIEELNCLAFPKGLRPICEITGLPATVRFVCSNTVLYYVTREHAELAWSGILHKILPLNYSFNENLSMHHFGESKKLDTAREEYKTEMMKMCFQESKFLYDQGRYDLVFPGALMALKLAKEIYGIHSLEIVSAYIILGKASLRLGRLQKANEFLTCAKWTNLKHSHAGPNFEGEIHKNLGILYTLQDKLSKALEEFSYSLYYSSIKFGPEHCETASIYFLMADGFYKQSDFNAAISFFNKVVDIWWNFIRHFDSTVLHNGELYEKAIEEVHHISSIFRRYFGDEHVSTVKSESVLSALYEVTSSSNENISLFKYERDTKNIFREEISLAGKNEQ